MLEIMGMIKNKLNVVYITKDIKEEEERVWIVLYSKIMKDWIFNYGRRGKTY